MKIKLTFLTNKGDNNSNILWLFLKFYYFSTVVVSSICSSMYILSNNSNIAYFWHNIFKLIQTFILTGFREYL